jgi:hypothetical protein
MRQTLLTLVLLATPRVLFACPVCFGQNDSPLASAINLGVIAMLGVVAAVLTAFASFMIYLARRARLVADGSAASQAGPQGLAASRPQEGSARC